MSDLITTNFNDHAGRMPALPATKIFFICQLKPDNCPLSSHCSEPANDLQANEMSDLITANFNDYAGRMPALPATKTFFICQLKPDNCPLSSHCSELANDLQA
jgi:hypothetical protein